MAIRKTLPHPFIIIYNNKRATQLKTWPKAMYVPSNILAAHKHLLVLALATDTVVVEGSIPPSYLYIFLLLE